MTRIFTDGAEFNDTLLFDNISGLSINNSVKRSGSYSYYLSNSAMYAYKTIAPVSEFYARLAFYTSGVNTSPFAIFRWRNGSTTLGDIRVDGSDRHIKAYVNDGAVATSLTHFSDNIWNLIEVHVIIADSGVIQVKINGILEIDYSGDTKPGSATNVDVIGLGGGDWNFYYDDLAFNDTNGSVDNSWCGNGYVEMLTPTGDSTPLSWSPVTGTSHYAMVDEYAKDDDTTYVTTSGAGIRETFSMSNFTDTNKVVKRIWAEGRAKDASASSTQIKLGIKTSEGNILLGSGITLASNYGMARGTELLVNPVGSGLWNKTSLDAIEFVIESE